jgi:hypothetical protein
MPHARISLPDKNAMQSGKAKDAWLLEFEQDSPYFVEPLMGWTGMRDTRQQIRLNFPTQEAAVAYARKQGYTFEVIDPKPRKQIKKAYADNFRYNKL